jgi:hypothetical protein
MNTLHAYRHMDQQPELYQSRRIQPNYPWPEFGRQQLAWSYPEENQKGNLHTKDCQLRELHYRLRSYGTCHDGRVREPTVSGALPETVPGIRSRRRIQGLREGRSQSRTGRAVSKTAFRMRDCVRRMIWRPKLPLARPNTKQGGPTDNTNLESICRP